jgi:hypothetical protein
MPQGKRWASAAGTRFAHTTRAHSENARSGNFISICNIVPGA